jgi:ABC-type arginine transport system permease subunit
MPPSSGLEIKPNKQLNLLVCRLLSCLLRVLFNVGNKKKIHSFETSINFYKTALRDIPEHRICLLSLIESLFCRFTEFKPQ